MTRRSDLFAEPSEFAGGRSIERRRMNDLDKEEKFSNLSIKCLLRALSINLRVGLVTEDVGNNK